MSMNCHLYSIKNNNMVCGSVCVCVQEQRLVYISLVLTWFLIFLMCHCTDPLPVSTFMTTPYHCVQFYDDSLPLWHILWWPLPLWHILWRPLTIVAHFMVTPYHCGTFYDDPLPESKGSSITVCGVLSKGSSLILLCNGKGSSEVSTTIILTLCL